MIANIIPSVITAIIGPLLTYFIIDWHKHRPLKTIRAGRKKALDGTWQGSANQEAGPEGSHLHADLRYSLSASRKTVRGKGMYRTRIEGEDRWREFAASGGFLHDRFLKLDYKNTDDSTIQFGSAVLELSADGKKLAGYYLGYGATSECLVYGTIELEKQA